MTTNERFQAKTQPTTSGCVEWTGALSRHSRHPERGGYGQFRVGDRVLYAHRVAYESAYGPIPAGMECDHRCANRRCVNPNHLRLLSKAENIRDANARRYATA